MGISWLMSCNLEGINKHIDDQNQQLNDKLLAAKTNIKDYYEKILGEHFNKDTNKVINFTEIYLIYKICY